MMRQATIRRTPMPRPATARAFDSRTNSTLAATLASLAALSLLAVVALLALSLTGCAPDGAGGTVQVRGILTGESTECQALTSEDGELYALTGDLGDVQTGDMVEARGTLGDEDECDGGIVVHVSGLEVVDGPNTGMHVGEADEGEIGEMDDDGSMDQDADDMIQSDSGAGEQLLLEGELTDLTDEGGTECQGFRSDEGELYSLTGDLGDLATGDRVRIIATPTEDSTCAQGQTVEIVEIGLIDEERDATQM